MNEKVNKQSKPSFVVSGRARLTGRRAIVAPEEA
jgi:hypothetical protein